MMTCCTDGDAGEVAPRREQQTSVLSRKNIYYNQFILTVDFFRIPQENGPKI
jgi:hypothetical protein